MDAEQYSLLLEELKSGCTLILGPEFCRLTEEASLNESLRDFIAEKHSLAKTYVNEDGFFYSDEIIKKNSIVKRIGEFYRGLGKNEVPFYYQLIAQMPFHFIISLSPDDLLHQALREQKKEHSFVYFKKGSELKVLSDKPLPKDELYKKPEIYSKEKISDVDFTPSNEKTLLFNFLGIYDDEESFVFTYDSLFQFLYAIFPETKLPDQLRRAITNSSSFLFLGFQYDKWYLKIIFFLLEKIFDNASADLSKKAIFNFSADQQKTVDFYKNQFGILFSQEKTLGFIYQLYNDCNKQGLLSAPAEDPKILESVCRIVHISSNPEGANPLDFDTEFKNIEIEWKKSWSRNKFETKRFGAVTQKEFLKTLQDAEPELLIVSVHGTKDLTLYFKDENNQIVPFSLEEFKKDLALMRKNGRTKLQGIVFHCCHSDKYADELVKEGLLDFAIGMEGMINDEAVPEFAEGFFGAYFTSKDFSYAYESGVRFLEKSNRAVIKKASTQPKLFTKAKQ